MKEDLEDDESLWQVMIVNPDQVRCLGHIIKEQSSSRVSHVHVHAAESNWCD